MCQENQLYQKKDKQILYESAHEEVVDNQQIMRNAPLQQQELGNEQQMIRVTAYDRFFRNLKPLPALPVPAGSAPQEEKAGKKDRKRKEKQDKKQLETDQKGYVELNKELSKNPKLMDLDDVKNLPIFKTKQGREKWAGEKLSHSKLTREETMRKILDEDDYSNFENLDLVMRNMIAGIVLKDFKREFHITPASNVAEVCEQLKQRGNQKYGKGVSVLLNPALRLGLSLAQRTESDPDMVNFYRELDEAMSTAVMVSTLTSVSDTNTVEEHYRKKGAKNYRAAAATAIEANKAQQIQIAKRLLLMQLSNFHKITKDGNGNPVATPWDKSMAVALSHCSRVVLTLPKQDEGTSNAEEQQAMWKSIMTTRGENAAGDNRRGSSTHSIKRREVSRGGGVVTSKEKKLPFNFLGQRGMNCAIGGLGNAGVSGKILDNDGSCGHFYSMYKEADQKNYGAMLMGIESDANGVTNQMGHTHDIKATAEKASSLGGQRTDEVGEKYGGRQCDLTGYSAVEISTWMKALENAMIRWQGSQEGMETEEAVTTMKLLAGMKMSPDNLVVMRHILHIPDIII